MEEKYITQISNDNYANAFLAVARIVAPFCNFSEVEISKRFTPNGVEIKPSVMGYNVVNNVNVEVTTEEDANKGTQIVVNYLDDNGNIVAQTETWYYNFNWKGLMTLENNKKQ